MQAFSTRSLRQLAVLVTVLLALQLLWSVFSWIRLAPPDPISPAHSVLQFDGTDDENGALTGQEDAVAVEPLQNLSARPLFWAGRMPFVPLLENEATAEQVKPRGRSSIQDAKLLGVYGAGNHRGIIVSLAGERRRILMGQEVDGWTLSMLAADGAIFENGSQTTTIDLEHAGPSPAAPAKVNRSQRLSDANRRAIQAQRKRDQQRRAETDTKVSGAASR